MKTPMSLFRRGICGLVLTLLVAPSALAFPPALPHSIYGLARDEFGNPLTTNATVVLTTSSGVSVSCQVVPGLQPGVNYRMTIPMDSAVRSDFYKSVAQQPSVPFRLRVMIGGATFLPIEMTGDYSLLGQPGKQTQIDLTLGEDKNGNGLPDAWEQALIGARGWNVSLTNLTASSSPGGNGVTLLQEYVAGTYGFQDGAGLNLKVVRVVGGAPVLEFMAVRGRNYSVVGSADLKTWQAVSFQRAEPGADPAMMESFQSGNVQLLQVTAPVTGSQAGLRFFKLRIQ
ncbi:MAG: hypothetical protein HZA92_06475 [Verrucomicrobia bacterium]|nr:hypothetical protein [Verrucomicrobiota bacterium]